MMGWVVNDLSLRPRPLVLVDITAFSPFNNALPFTCLHTHAHCFVFVVLLLVVGNFPPVLRINLAIEYRTLPIIDDLRLARYLLSNALARVSKKPSQTVETSVQ